MKYLIKAAFLAITMLVASFTFAGNEANTVLDFVDQQVVTTDYNGLKFDYNLADQRISVVCKIMGAYKAVMTYTDHNKAAETSTIGNYHTFIFTNKDVAQNQINNNVDIYHVDAKGTLTLGDASNANTTAFASCRYAFDVQ